jgi:hypothetical protein
MEMYMRKYPLLHSDTNERIGTTLYIAVLHSTVTVKSTMNIAHTLQLV